MKIKSLYLSFIAYLLFLPFSSMAQFRDSKPLEVGVLGGVSTYNGDLIKSNFTFKQSHAAFGLFVSKEIHKGFGAEIGVNFGKISGADSLHAFKNRNLDFQSNILDAHLLINYNIHQDYVPQLTPYVFAGIAVYHFDPYTYYQGEKTYLQPLGTVGQGSPGAPSPYSLTQASIPFGLGLKYEISSKVSIAAVLSYRATFTDYIDDVSGYYVDKSQLSPKSAKLAFRGDEVSGHHNAQYPTGELRGNPDKNDVYYFTGIKLSIQLSGSTHNRVQRRIRQRRGRGLF